MQSLCSKQRQLPFIVISYMHVFGTASCVQKPVSVNVTPNSNYGTVAKILELRASRLPATAAEAAQPPRTKAVDPQLRSGVCT